MPPQCVGQVEDRRSSGCAGVKNGEDGLEVAIQVNYRPNLATDFQSAFPGVPPRVGDACRKDRAFSHRHNFRFASDSRSKCSGLDVPRFIFEEMDVRRWTILSRRQGTVNEHNQLTLGIPRPAQLQNFSRVAVL
jgi:hypothetical protein